MSFVAAAFFGAISFILLVPAAAASDDWTLCMTPNAPAKPAVARCARVLQRRDLSPFQRSLLLGAEGDGLHRLHLDQRAVGAYTQALALTPADEVDLAARGEAVEALGRLTDAHRDYDAAISRHEANLANRSNGSADVIANDYALRGRLLLALRRPSLALRDFRAAVRLYPQGETPQLKELAAQAERLARP